jgi:hypothetical protein
VSSFETPLVVTPLDDGIRWEVLQPFQYKIGSIDSSEVIEVPIGFITDFASIPKLFWNVLSPWGVYGKAAVIHDWLYKNNGKVGKYTYTRKQCDQIFLEAMVVLKVGNFTRWLMYNAVRWFGQGTWNSYAKKAA